MTSPLIVGLGEALIRLTAPHHGPLESADRFDAIVAGSELNLLIAAQALGASTRWLTRVPENDLGRAMLAHARRYGVEVIAVTEPGGRAGLFFYECGTPPRPSKVLYDRQHSAMSHVTPEDFEWTTVLANADVAHTSGITLAVSVSAGASARRFFECARGAGVVTSLDMNYRPQLWSLEEATPVYRDVVSHVDILFCAPADFRLLLDETGDVPVLADLVRARYNVETVVVRERRAIDATHLATSVHVFGPDAATATADGQVVDEIGAGDAAAAAYLAARFSGLSAQASATLCARAWAWMLTLPGDAWTGSRTDLLDHFSDSRKVRR